MDDHHADYGDDVPAWLAGMKQIEHLAPAGADTWLTIVETLSDTAVPLPRTVFNGPNDIRYVPTPDRTGLTLAPGREADPAF
ncbi:hypothetical protein BJY14_007844 [Actinomadura luteofluorescens]|uniref:Uncharacterized protein n=1 Tax=Actinomadura luteofluorescens TaxID=46163 RepID=A0A7Y9JKH9_9ACTN|nr:hypothetical protein [Actinomadura luteofluorescens]NYD51861.1 hypothetical protein [Actinomadura luteofluorescens]